MTTSTETLDAEATEAAASADAEPGPAGWGEPLRLEQGESLGRYVVLRTLGAGAMGTVSLCYDPELDRRVALKLWRGASSPRKRQALLREAQAMAKLTHPNVVTVHDVGEHEGRIYVAMEFVQGDTLKRWLASERRSWRAILDVFVEAGRGLQAAHGRELIHRDFKPDNVMISHEGRVRVMDFGLARPKTGAADSQSVDISGSSSLLTEATVGRVAGTPAYMAPEQVRAATLTPAADQFAYCVSLWEALCGERPFEGFTNAELFTNTSEGNIRPPPSDARMPRWLKRVLVRGLQPRAHARWPSMTALLAKLERGRHRWRGQVALVGFVGVAAPVGISMANQQAEAREHQERVAACESEGATVDQIWNDAQRARLAEGLLSTGVRFAQSSVDTLIPWLDAYHDAWRSGRAQACMHHDVEQDWDDAMLARSAWCFEDRRLAFEATVNQIAKGDAKAARRAVRLASYLEPVANCLDANLLRRLPMPPPDMRDETRSIRKTLAAVDGLRHAGRSAQAFGIAREARIRAETLGWPPVVAASRFLEGRCLLEEGRASAANTTLTTAYFEAQRTGSVEVAFRAARSLMRALTTMRRYTEAEVWGDHANVLAADLDDPRGLDEAEGHYLMIRVYQGLGRHDAAAAAGETAMRMRSDALGTHHPITAAAARSLGRVYLEQTRADEALELFEQSYDVWLDAVGRDHHYVGDLACLRGRALLALGRTEDALVWLVDGLEMLHATRGADHPSLAEHLDALANAYLTLGYPTEAEVAQRRALGIRRVSNSGR